MSQIYTSYLSAKLLANINKSKGGCGIYAKETINKGELLCIWGGQILTHDELNRLTSERKSLSLQVEEGLYLCPLREHEPADYFNHSCDPNAGLDGQICLVAMRDILPGEEVCFDYAMCDGSEYDEFECNCGTDKCRHFIRGTDWSNPDLWDMYEGYFSPYLQRRINQLRSGS